MVKVLMSEDIMIQMTLTKCNPKSQKTSLLVILIISLNRKVREEEPKVKKSGPKMGGTVQTSTIVEKAKIKMMEMNKRKRRTDYYAAEN